MCYIFWHRRSTLDSGSTFHPGRTSLMFDRISASFTLAGNSWQVLRQDKKLIVFPILSGIGCFLVLASFILPLFVLRPGWLTSFFDFLDSGPRGNNGQGQSPWPYLLGFAFYFCNYFVIVFCNAA